MSELKFEKKKKIVKQQLNIRTSTLNCQLNGTRDRLLFHFLFSVPLFYAKCGSIENQSKRSAEIERECVRLRGRKKERKHKTRRNTEHNQCIQSTIWLLHLDIYCFFFLFSFFFSLFFFKLWREIQVNPLTFSYICINTDYECRPTYDIAIYAYNLRS